MDFETFRERFMEDIKDAYERATEREVAVSAETVNKLNDSYEAIMITPKGSKIGLNLNVDNFYEAYNQGKDYGELVEKAVEVIQENIEFKPSIEVSAFTDYEQMKQTIAIEVVSAERNKEMLENIPHQMMEDMAVVYRFVIESDNGGRGTILATHKLLESMETTAEQLFEDAMKIAPEKHPVVIKGMWAMLEEIMGPEGEFRLTPEDLLGEEKMFVATVPDKIHGAGVIAYPDFMEQAKEALGCDFFILPSSIHEVILVKDDGATDYSELKGIVEMVNAEQVPIDEQLTDNVYHYDSQDKVFELAEKFEARKQEREAASLEKGEKGSVLKNLKDKQNIVDKTVSSIDASIKTPKLKEGVAL